MARILFVPSVGRGIIQFKLILEELNKSGGYSVTTIAIDMSRAVALEKEGFPFRDIAAYHTRNMLKIIKVENPDILVTDFSSPETINLIKAATYSGIPSLMIDCGIKSDSAPIVQAHNKHLGQKFAVWLKSGRKFQSLPFSLATLLDTSRFWQLPARLVREVLNFFHGLPGYVEGLNIAVLSPSAREWFARDGVPLENLFVIGQPRFDLIQKQKYDATRLRTELGVPEDKGIVVLATQPMVESYLWTEKEREKFIEVVAGGMQEFPEKQLVIKLHPDENIDIYRRILTDIGDAKTIVCRDTDTYELLHACDLLITFYSTVALEAMLFNKPVITVNLFGKTDIFPFARSGAALGVYQEEEIVPAIKKSLYDTGTREDLLRKSRGFTQEHIYQPDGQAAQRGAELIRQLVGQATTGRKNV